MLELKRKSRVEHSLQACFGGPPEAARQYQQLSRRLLLKIALSVALQAVRCGSALPQAPEEEQHSNRLALLCCQTLSILNWGSVSPAASVHGKTEKRERWRRRAYG